MKDLHEGNKKESHLRMEPMAGIGHFSPRMYHEDARFHELLKHTPPLLDQTGFNSLGVRVGVR